MNAPNEILSRAVAFAGMFAGAVVDLFAGAGGASIGIEQAYCDAGYTDRYVDLMVNHWDVAVGVHEANHPMTEHLHASVWEVDPATVLPGRWIAHLHLSPDCVDFSRAKGSRPKRKHIRALADVGLIWAGKRRPKVITLENVPEFKEWGPLGANEQPDPARRGQEFRRWVGELQALGYQVDHRELKACDYGAPTTRKRLFVIARCDGQPIIWPEKTHGKEAFDVGGYVAHGNSKEDGVRHRGNQGLDQGDGRSRRHGDQIRSAGTSGKELPNWSRRNGFGASCRLKPYRTAAECIDWSLPMLSIFATPAEAKAWAAQINVGRAKEDRVGVPRRPLKPKTMARIAGGLDKFVIRAARPFIVDIQNYGWDSTATRDIDQPMGTITGNPKGGAFAVVDAKVAPYTVPNLGERDGQAPRCGSVESPMPTITGSASGARLVAATLAEIAHGDTSREGSKDRWGRGTPDIRSPLGTVSGSNNHALVAAMMAPFTAGVGGRAGQSPETGVDRPLPTVTGKADRVVVGAFLSHLYGTNTGTDGDPAKPLPTVTGGGTHAAAVGVSLSNLEKTNDHIEPILHMRSVSAGVDDQPENGGRVEQIVGRHAQGAGTSTVRCEEIVASAGEAGAGSDQGGRVVPFLVGTGGAAYAAKPKAADEPANTVMVNDRRAIVAAFLAVYYSQGSGKTGQPIDAPAPTVTGKDRIQLVTVTIDGQTYVVTDIAMRMLTPRELANAQGFPADYVLDRTADGRRVSKADQVRLIGNSVPPAFMRAIVHANVISQGVLDESPVSAGGAA